MQLYISTIGANPELLKSLHALVESKGHKISTGNDLSDKINNCDIFIQLSNNLTTHPVSGQKEITEALTLAKKYEKPSIYIIETTPMPPNYHKPNRGLIKIIEVESIDDIKTNINTILEKDCKKLEFGSLLPFYGKPKVKDTTLIADQKAPLTIHATQRLILNHFIGRYN